MKDIAKAAGVHFSTVSLALSGSAKVAAQTRDRVLEIAQRLGYQRDPVYNALSAHRSSIKLNQIPVIVFLTNRATLAEFHAEPHMPAFFEGARVQAEAMGFACELVLVSNETQSQNQIEDLLISRGVQGIIIGAFMPHLAHVHVEWSRYATVKIDSWFMSPPVTRISHDQIQIVRLACRRLHGIGYGRIGLAVGQIDEDSSDDLFHAGYRLEQHLLGLPVLSTLIFEYGESSAVSAERLRHWVRQERLDAVVSNWDLRELIRFAGLRVPHDIAYANLCLNEPNPTMAGMLVHHAAVGKMAVEMIALLIKTRQFGIPKDPSCLYVEAEWQDGTSAPARQMI